MRGLRALARAFVVVAAVAAASGTASVRAQPRVGPEPAEVLADLRLADLATDRGAGFVLLGWGATSVVAGSAIAIAGGLGDSAFWLTMGLTHATWGLVNGLLALTLFDLSGSAREDIERARRSRGELFFDARDDSIGEAYSSAIMFAVNAGLDVFYVATGILLFALGREQSDADVRDGLSAFGIASAMQGALLLPFDISAWVRGVSRAHERRRVRVSETARAP